MFVPGRRGYSLMEITTVLCITLVITGVAVTLTVSLMRLRDARREAHALSVSLGQIEPQWRGDVRAAASVGPGSRAAGPWELQRPDGSVVQYRWHDPLLERTVRRGTAVESHDAVRLPLGTRVTCELPKSPMELASLTIDTPLSQQDLRARRSWSITAPLAADWRFAAAVKDSKP